MARRTLAQVIAEGDAIVLAKNNEIKSLKAKHQENLEQLRESSSNDFVKYKKDIDSLNYKIDKSHAYIKQLEDGIDSKDTQLGKYGKQLHNSNVIIGLLLFCLVTIIVFYFYKVGF